MGAGTAPRRRGDRMKRREFISTLIAAAIIPAAQAQQQQHVKVHRIAVVSASTALAPGAFFEELRRLGYVEGRNLVLERYSGEGRTEHYGELARNVVRQKPDLIFANSSRLVREFKAATAVIPIVAVTADPIAFGLVASLARPGGNITGVSTDAGKEILGKYLEVLRDIVPAASRVAYLAAKGIWETRYGREMQEVAQRSGISLLGP